MGWRYFPIGHFPVGWSMALPMQPDLGTSKLTGRAACMRPGLIFLPRTCCRGFSLVEIVIVALVMSLLVPAITASRTRAQQVQCASQLRQLHAALLMYASSNGG